MRWLAPKSERSAARPCAAPSFEALEARDLPDAAGDRLFINQAFRDLLRRAADPAALSLYGGALAHSGLNRGQVALAIEASPEFRAARVQGLYGFFLGRAADNVGAAAFHAVIDVGRPVEAFEAQLLGSSEYYQNRGGGTDDGFITALYADLLGRSADPGARTFLEQALAHGIARTQVAAAVLTGDEFRQDLVQGFYRQFLGRAADAGGLAAFTAYLRHGGRDEYVIAALVGSDEYYFDLNPPSATFSSAETLTADEVGQLLQRAAAATGSDDGIVAVVDRGGRILGVRVEGHVAPAVTGHPGSLVFAIDGAVALARTGAFFANNQAPLTARTVQFISQSTITQREVESNPNVPDPNSALRGPGFVAPVGVGGHFPPNVMFTPQVDLFAIEHTNRDSTFRTGPNRFNVHDAFIPANIPPDQRLVAPDSYGFVSGLLPGAQSRGIATLPGGLPIFKDGTLVGGIGVFFPGQTGFATEENSFLSTTFDPRKPDRSLEAEYDAFAAVGGSSGAGFPIGPLGGVAPLPGFDLPFGRIDLVGITLDIFGPGGIQGPENLVRYGLTLGHGDPNSGTNQQIDAAHDLLKGGVPVPEGWLVTPHAGGGLTADDVTRIIQQGIDQANATRAAIRLPLGSRTRMVFAVTDRDGNVLGLYRMPDATVFSLDVAVAKARNVAYYADAGRLQPQDRVPGVSPGVAFTNRTFRYLAEPRFPEGIDGAPPGPFSVLRDGGADPVTGKDVGPPLPASAFQSVLGHDAFNPGTNFHDPFNPANQNGIVFFPGSSPLYKTVNGQPVLVGGLGVSGDGVDQDDVVTFAASSGFAAPLTVTRADQVTVGGVRLPYQKFNRNPEG